MAKLLDCASPLALFFGRSRCVQVLPGGCMHPESIQGFQSGRGLPHSKTLARMAKLFMCAGLLAFLVCGCSSDRGVEGLRALNSPEFAPLPPEFLSGPAALLLTNSQEFSAHVVLSGSSSSTTTPPSFLSGQLLARAGSLLFAPDPGAHDKKPSLGGFTYIWDVARNQGFVVSEALQGYAPASAHGAATNLITRAGKASGESVDGHPCTTEEAIVQMGDGSTANFQILRASDLKGLALRISKYSDSTPFSLSLSKVRLESPAANLFAPPDGFTRFTSAETMLTELVLRQNNLKRPPGSSAEPVYAPPPPSTRH